MSKNNTSGDHGWDETYSEHSVWDAIERLIDEIAHTKVVRENNVPDVDLLLLRLKSILGRRNTPSLLITDSYLNSLEGHVSNLRQQFKTWETNHQSRRGTWQGVENALDNVLGTARGWPTSDLISIKSAATSLGHATKALKREIEAFNEQTDQIKQEVNSNFDDASSRLGEINETAKAVETSLNQLEEEARSALTAFQQQFAERSEHRATEFQKQQSAFKERFADFLSKTQDDLDEFINNIKDAAQGEIEQIGLEREKAEKIVGAIGTYSTASAYQTYSDRQRINANWMRGIAIFLYVLTFGVLAWTIFLSNDNLNSWIEVVQRTSVTATLLGGAAYASIESKRHREREHLSKQTEMKLLALEPFIAPLTPTQQTQIRSAMANRVFVEDLPFQGKQITTDIDPKDEVEAPEQK